MGADGVYRGDNGLGSPRKFKSSQMPHGQALRFAREDEAIAPAAGAGESAG